MSDKQATIEREEDRPPVRAVDFLYGVFFIGILLTFSVYVAVTMLLGAQISVGDRYLTDREYNMPLPSYNEAYYKNTTLQDLITQYDYSLFGKVNNKNVLVGKENFLFEVIREENDYNYLRDHLGEFSYEQEGLDSIYSFLKMRQTAYNNQGIEYIVAVIPNAQTIYSEYLPSYFQDNEGTTRLEQLTGYLKTKDDITMIDLTAALMAAKSNGVLYNNTEDSLNSLGEYFVYQALYNALPERFKSGTAPVPFDHVTLYTHYTTGKTLADQAGLVGVVKNETVSLSNTMEFNYHPQELYTGVEITSASHNANGEEAGQTILLEFSNEWDKIQLMPYFSSTFDDVVYKSDHDFSVLALDTARPSLVIQFIHEYELNSLTDSHVTQTYSDGLNAGENLVTTSPPVVTGQVWVDVDTVCLSGWVEAGSELTVSGDAAHTRTVYAGADENLFFVLIDMTDLWETEVRLQASVADKAQSRIETVAVTRAGKVIKPNTKVVVGDQSRLFSTAYADAILPDTGTLSAMETELTDYIVKVLAQVAVKQPEFINVVIPGSGSVYRDLAPEDMKQKLQAPALCREAIGEAYRASGWTVLDLTEALRQNIHIGKLYGLTFDQWTDYGAYIGYKTLMTHIQKDYPNMEITPLSEYTRVTQITAGGELYGMLGFESKHVSELQTHLKLHTPEVSYVANGGEVVDLTGAYTTMVADGSLPVAIVLRDSAGTEMLESMARHFCVMIVLPEGEVEISQDILTLFEPDYVIRLAGENTPGLYDTMVEQENQRTTKP